MLDGGDGDGLEEVGVEVGDLRLLLGDLFRRLLLGYPPRLRLGWRWGPGLLRGCLGHVVDVAVVGHILAPGSWSLTLVESESRHVGVGNKKSESAEI